MSHFEPSWSWISTGGLAGIAGIMPSLSSPRSPPLAGGEMHPVESVVAEHGANTLIPAIKASTSGPRSWA
ncbi:hypothetical protein GCM10027176_73220 [Actinoallomurus bryophytorum]